jgi:hypothetical protein
MVIGWAAAQLPRLSADGSCDYLVVLRPVHALETL